MTAPEERLAELMDEPDPTPEQEAAGTDRLIAEVCRGQAPWTALWRKRAELALIDEELADEGRRAVERIDNQAGAEGATSAPETAAPLRGNTAMSTISDGHEDISIVGTGITKIPGKAHPEFAGLRVGEDGVPVARIEDGALVIEVDDLGVALAWRNVWQHAVSHLVMHRERKAGRP